jgi:hypothetical protein
MSIFDNDKKLRCARWILRRLNEKIIVFTDSDTKALTTRSPLIRLENLQNLTNEFDLPMIEDTCRTLFAEKYINLFDVDKSKESSEDIEVIITRKGVSAVENAHFTKEIYMVWGKRVLVVVGAAVSMAGISKTTKSFLNSKH